MSTAAPRSVPALIDAAAADEKLGPHEGQELLDYFLTNRKLPNAAATLDLDVEVGSYLVDGELVGGKVYSFKFRRLSWSEVKDHEQNATFPGRFHVDGSPWIDEFVLASWHCARAMVAPSLSGALAALRAADARTAPKNTAALLQEMFETESGTLIDMSGVLLAHSKLRGRATVRQSSPADAAAATDPAVESSKEMEAAGN